MDLAKKLLDLDADLLLCIHLGQSSLRSAIDSGRPEMVELNMNLRPRGIAEPCVHFPMEHSGNVHLVPCEEYYDWEIYENETTTGSGFNDKIRT